MKFFPINSIELKITNKCMLKCVFCANKDGPDNNKVVDVNRALNALQELLDAPDNLGDLKNLYFTGGETLLGLRYIKKIVNNIPSNIFTSIVTNGLLLNKDSLRKINNLEINRIKISYDTTDKNLLPVIRHGMRSSHLKMIERNIARSVESGILVFLRVALTKKNYKDLCNIYRKAIKLGVHVLQIKPIISAGRARANRFLFLSKIELDNTLRELSNIYDGERTDISISCYPPAAKFNLPVKYCANNKKLYLDTNGEIYTCNYIMDKFNNFGNYLEPEGLIKALYDRKSRFEMVFNEDNRISNCPSLMY